MDSTRMSLRPRFHAPVYTSQSSRSIPQMAPSIEVVEVEGRTIRPVRKVD